MVRFILLLLKKFCLFIFFNIYLEHRLHVTFVIIFFEKTHKNRFCFLFLLPYYLLMIPDGSIEMLPWV